MLLTEKRETRTRGLKREQVRREGEKGTAETTNGEGLLKSYIETYYGRLALKYIHI